MSPQVIQLPRESFGLLTALEERRARRKLPRFLYFLRHPWEPWLKVGIAADVKQRVRDYAGMWGISDPFPPIALPDGDLASMRGRARPLEQWILTHFRHDIVQGEWLRLTDRVRRMERAAFRLWDDPSAEPGQRQQAVREFAAAIGWPKELLLV